jgi:hypothetical protein
MSARSLYAELHAADAVRRWEILEKWVADKTEETLHLEFKHAEAQNCEPTASDIKNLAKGLSGFANTEGGLLVFGIKTKKTELGDRADKFTAVEHWTVTLKKEKTKRKNTGNCRLLRSAQPHSCTASVLLRTGTRICPGY